MANLIEDKVNPAILQEIRQKLESKKSAKFGFKFFFSILLILIVLSSLVYFTSIEQKAEAVQFGLGNDYNEIVELNSSIASNVPFSIEPITTSEAKGDKRVVALLIFFEKYKSPMAKTSIAKAFVEGADKNGFGDKWYLLPAISGIESGFGKIIPYHGNTSSYNAWGWSGGSKYGRWSYFSSWEDAALQVSAGIAKGYARTNLIPEKMMASYCPPCALPQNKGLWAKTVNNYIKEMQQIHSNL